MAYCPWSGVKDCGCGAYPFTWNGLMPARCEERLPIYMVNAYLKPQYVTDATKERYERWVRDGMPKIGADEVDDAGAEQAS